MGNLQDAQKCVNDSYLAVWNTVPPQEPDPLSAYVLKTVHNFSVSFLRENSVGSVIKRVPNTFNGVYLHRFSRIHIFLAEVQI